MSEKSSLKEEHGDVCPHTIAFLFDNWIRRLFQSPSKIVGEYLKEGDQVMDCGCGPGFFSLEMAKLVGKQGKVFAVDLQQQMLDKLEKKAIRKGLNDRIVLHQSQPEAIGLEAAVDFILVFYMIHETPNPQGFLAEMKELLKENGRILIVEPKMHTDQKLFEEFVKMAEEAGLDPVDFPKKKGGRSVLLAQRS